METTGGSHDALRLGIQEGWRQLREAVLVLALASTRDSEAEVVEARGIYNAVSPILQALTGRSDDVLMTACVNRLMKDGRLPKAPLGVD